MDDRGNATDTMADQNMMAPPSVEETTGSGGGLSGLSGPMTPSPDDIMVNDNSESASQGDPTFSAPNPNTRSVTEAPAGKGPSKWEQILTGALVGLAGGAGAKNFAQGVSGGAKATLAYDQQQTENAQHQEELTTRKAEVQSNIRFRDAEQAYRAAMLTNQDKQLMLQTQEHQDMHDKSQAELVKYNMENFGLAYDAIPNNSANATKFLEQGTTNARATGANGVGIPHGIILTSSTIYVPKEGTNSIEQQFDQGKTYATAMGLPVPPQQAFQTIGVQGRAKIIERLEYQLRGLDPNSGEYYAPDKLPGAISAMQNSINSYTKDPAHKPEVLSIMQSSLSAMNSELKGHRDSKVADAKAEIPVAAAKAAATADATARAQMKVVDEYSASTVDQDSASLLAQTGLSQTAFALLTGSGNPPRDKASRMAANREIQTWAAKNNVDTSLLASQYKAANQAVQQNVLRLNNTAIMENEIQGTIQNLQAVVKKEDLGKLNAENVVKVWGGQQVNDPLAQQYAMHLSQLRNELTAYFGATQGRTGNNLTVQDKVEAEGVLKTGIAKGSLEGLSTAVASSTAKMRPIMENSVRSSQHQVWGLFGKADKFDATHPVTGGGKASFNWNDHPKVN